MRREALEEGLVKQELVASHGGGGTSAETVINGGAESTGENGETTTDGDAAERCSPCSSSLHSCRPSATSLPTAVKYSSLMCRVVS